MKILKLGAFVFIFLSCQPLVWAQAASHGIDPRILSASFPDYPQAAKNAGLGGTVFVTVLIDRKGKTTVKDVFGPNAPCSNLDDPLAAAIQNASVEAAKKTVFEPATWKGKPVDKGFILKYFFDPQSVRVDPGAAGGNSGLGRIVNGQALSIPKPKYPSNAQGVMGGTVDVSVVIFEDGKVHFAGALSGHRVLRRAAVEAACKATFSPTILNSNNPVKVLGRITYVFYNTYERG